MFEEMELAVYWTTDGVDQCQVGLTSWHLVKHGDCIGTSNGGIQCR